MLGAVWRPFPQEHISKCGPDSFMDCRIPFEQIQTRRKPANPVDENAEVQTRFPRQCIPGRYSGARQQTV